MSSSQSSHHASSDTPSDALRRFAAAGRVAAWVGLLASPALVPSALMVFEATPRPLAWTVFAFCWMYLGLSVAWAVGALRRRMGRRSSTCTPTRSSLMLTAWTLAPLAVLLMLVLALATMIAITG